MQLGQTYPCSTAFKTRRNRGSICALLYTVLLGRCVFVGEETRRRGFPQATQLLAWKSSGVSVNTAVTCVSAEQLALFLVSTR